MAFRLGQELGEVELVGAGGAGGLENPSGHTAAGVVVYAGLLALAKGDPQGAVRLDRSLTHPDARAEQERKVFGCTVAAASAYLLGLWNFPETIVFAVASQPLSEDEPGSSTFERILGYAYHRVIGGPGVQPQAPDIDEHQRLRWSTAAQTVLAPAEAEAPAGAEEEQVSG